MKRIKPLSFAIVTRMDLSGGPLMMSFQFKTQDGEVHNVQGLLAADLDGSVDPIDLEHMLYTLLGQIARESERE